MEKTKLNINDFFSQIYLINLKRRADRLENWFNKNDKHFTNKNINVFHAIEPREEEIGNWLFSPGALGCLESHLTIIKEAKKNNYKNILIFEDDCILNSNFNEHLSNVITCLPANWDMLYLCAQHFSPPSEFNEYLVKCNSTLLTVAYAINNRMYNTYIELLEKRIKQVDVVFAHLHYLIDAYATKEELCEHIGLYDSDVTSRKLIAKQNIFKKLISRFK